MHRLLFSIFFVLLSSLSFGNSNLPEVEVFQLKNLCHYNEIDNGVFLYFGELKDKVRILGSYLGAENPEGPYLEILYLNALSQEKKKKLFISSSEKSEQWSRRLNNSSERWELSEEESLKDVDIYDFDKYFLLFADDNCKFKSVSIIGYIEEKTLDRKWSETKHLITINSKEDFKDLYFNKDGEFIPPGPPAHQFISNPKFPGTNLPFLKLAEISSTKVYENENERKLDLNSTLQQICKLYDFDEYVPGSVTIDKFTNEKYGIIYYHETTRFEGVEISADDDIKKPILREILSKKEHRKILKKNNWRRKIYPNRKITNLSCKINNRNRPRKLPLTGIHIAGKSKAGGFMNIKTIRSPVIVHYEDVLHGKQSYPLLHESIGYEACRQFNFSFLMTNGKRTAAKKNETINGVRVEGNGYKVLTKGLPVNDLFCFRENTM